MKNLLALLLVVSLPGCATTNNAQGVLLEDVVAGCYEAGANTWQISSCVHDVYSSAGLSLRSDKDYRRIAPYLQMLDGLGFQVSEGKITEKEATGKALDGFISMHRSRFDGKGGVDFCVYKLEGNQVVYKCN